MLSKKAFAQCGELERRDRTIRILGVQRLLARREIGVELCPVIPATSIRHFGFMGTLRRARSFTTRRSGYPEARPASHPGCGLMRVVLLMRQILRVPHQLERVDRCVGSVGAIDGVGRR